MSSEPEHPAEPADRPTDPPVDRPALAALPPVDVVKVMESLPGVARIGAEAAINTAGWSLGRTLRASRRLVAATRDPREATELARDLGVAVGTVGEIARQVAAGVPLPEAVASVTAPAEQPPTTKDRQEAMTVDLRAKGRELLERSRDVWNDDTAHPAYERILDELAPDEARILLLLHREGPQPSVDVRTGGPVGMVSSELVAPGLTMIGPRAGVRYLDYVPSYLHNLFRLGLVWFSRESLRDPMPYQVLEAQPDVLEAMSKVRFPKVVRRSIHLTPFGHDFCAACLAPEDDPAPPPHATPD